MSETRDVASVTQTAAVLIPYRRPVPGSDNRRGEAFANLIRDGRRRKGWTQDRLVDASGVSRATVIRYESGEATRADPEQVRAICLALEIDPRQAAVALGYLTPEEIGPTASGTDELSTEEKEILAILRDPQVPSTEKAPLVDYLRFLGSQRRQGNKKTG